MPHKRYISVVALTAIAMSTLAVLTVSADAARRGQFGANLSGEFRERMNVTQRSFAERRKVRRVDNKRHVGTTNKPASTEDGPDKRPPAKGDNRPHSRPKPKPDYVADSDVPKPRKCPEGTRVSLRRGGIVCVDVLRPHRPGIVVVVPPPRIPARPVVVIDTPPTKTTIPERKRPPAAAATPALTLVPMVPPTKRPSTPPPAPPSAVPLPFQPTPALDNAVALPDEIVIALAASSATTVEDGVAQRFNLQILERSTLTLLGQRIVRLRIPDARSVPAVVAALQTDAVASSPQANFLYRPQQAASSNADLQYALAKVELASAHGTATGRGAVIGIIDTGVDTAHADLAGSDIKSFDAFGGDAAPDTHGTAVAGIIAARGTTHGIAPAAKLVTVRAFAAKRTATPQLSTSFVMLKSLDWVAAQQARVLNLSFAGPEDPLMRAAIAAINGKGVIVVAAAGNNGRGAKPVYPAAYDSVIAATAVDANDALYDKANVGSYVAIAAPGVDVFAASARNAHELHSGTSFAAAHVTGIVALMLEVNPRLSADEARTALANGALDLGPTGQDEQFGAGRVSAAASVRYVTEHVRH
jgi:subtilisin family serine protease